MGANITISTNMLGEHLVAAKNEEKVLDTNATVNEAIDYGYVMGKPAQIEYNVKGVLKAMVSGISKDANGRKLDSLFSIQPVVKGRGDDICDDIKLDELKVNARARALNGLKIDTSDWSVTVEGSTGNLTLNTVSSGIETGKITPTLDVNLNGFGLSLGDDDSVTYSVPELGVSGTIDSALITSEWTRLTIDKTAFSELTTSEYNGKKIVFKVKIGNNVGIKSAIIDLA